MIDGLVAAPNWTAILREIRQGAPRPVYLDYMRRIFNVKGEVLRIQDPLGIYWPDDQKREVYVIREDVEQLLILPFHTAFFGPGGFGKKTLAGYAPELFRSLSTKKTAVGIYLPQTLVVCLRLAEICSDVSADAIQAGKASVLTPHILAHTIFNRYWNDFIKDLRLREIYYPALRQDLYWRSALHWFFQRFPPYQADVPGQFEFMAWLRNAPEYELLSSAVSEQQTLEELVKFVTYKTDKSVANPSGAEKNGIIQPFNEIRIVISDDEYSAPAINRLLQDLQRLNNLKIDQLHFLLLMDDYWKESLNRLDCVRQGRLTCRDLPPWKPPELKQLLAQRLTAYAYPENIEVDWGCKIPDLNYALQKTLVDRIVGAEPYSGRKILLPADVLRLARGVLMACAGAWSEHGLQSESMHLHIRELIAAYDAA